MVKLIDPYRLAAAGLVVAVVVLAVAGLGFWRGMAAIEAMVETARAEAIAGRDAHWRAEIEKSNAAAMMAAAQQAIAAAKADAAATTQIAALEAELTQMETANVEIPDDGACGLDAGRVRILNTP